MHDLPLEVHEAGYFRPTRVAELTPGSDENICCVFEGLARIETVYLDVPMFITWLEV